MPAYPAFPPRSTETERLPGWHRSVQDFIDLRLLIVGGVTLTPHWVGPDFYASFWRLYHNRQAGARLILATGTLAIAADHTVIVPPWLHYDARCQGAVEHSFVHFLVPSLPDRTIQHLWPNPVDLGPAHPGGRLMERTIGGLKIGVDPSPQELALIKAGVLQCFSQALDSLASHDQDQLKVHLVRPSLFKELVAMIDADPARDWTVKDLAQRASLSPGRLNRHFKKHLDITPGGLVIERRLLAASERLLSTEDSIDDIASATGFANRFSFTRSFTRRFAISPAAYRHRGW